MEENVKVDKKFSLRYNLRNNPIISGTVGDVAAPQPGCADCPRPGQAGEAEGLRCSLPS